MTRSILKKRDTCYGCAVRCKRVVELPGEVDPRYGGPEYETVAALGSYCGVTSLETTARSNQLCNMYGLDTISCGATIAFAMECYERGIIGGEQTEGVRLSFGNGDARQHSGYNHAGIGLGQIKLEQGVIEGGPVGQEELAGGTALHMLFDFVALGVRQCAIMIGAEPGEDLAMLCHTQPAG